MPDTTSIAETAQALFCAIADLVGASAAKKVLDINRFPTYFDFKDYWESTDNPKRSWSIERIYEDRVDAPNVTLVNIEELFSASVSGREWYLSSVNIAQKLIADIQVISPKFQKIKGPNWSNILYQRGDEAVMGTVEALFKIANAGQKTVNQSKSKTKGQVFGNVNKWSPADIYLASPVGTKTLIKELAMAKKSKGYVFADLNETVCCLIETGELLPLSLKKQPKTSVKLELVNFARSTETVKVNKLSFQKVRPARWAKYTGTTGPNGKVIKLPSNQFRDVILYIDNTKNIKFRHDASGSGALKIEINDTSAPGGRAGSIGSAEILKDIIALVDPAFGNKFLLAYKQGEVAWRAKVKSKPMQDLYKRGKAKNVKNNPITLEYRRLAGDFSGQLVANAAMKLLVGWFVEDTKRTTRFIRHAFRYVTSRADTSARFVIAK